MKRPLTTYLGALICGLVAFSAFAPAYWFPGALIGPAGMFLLVRRRPWKTGRIAFFYATGLLLPQVYWLGEFQPIAPFAAVALSALMYALAGRAAGANSLQLATAFTAVEVFRATGIFAFPWGIMGVAGVGRGIEALPPCVGLWGISFAIYFTGFSITARPKLGVALVLIGIGLELSPTVVGRVEEGGDIRRIGIVQGNFEPERDYEFDPDGVTEFLFDETGRLADAGAGLVVWTETVILEYLNAGRPIGESIAHLAREKNVSILVGAPAIDSFGLKRNSAYLFHPHLAPGEKPPRYDKHHLVPFGEFLPFVGPDSRHRVLPEGVGDFTPSIAPLVLFDLGILICYESAFPDLARRLVNQGAELLIVLSNDAWSRSPLEARQLFDMTRLRAIELSRPVVRAGNVGVSGAISADGEIVGLLRGNRRSSVLLDVRISNNSTISRQFGGWFGWLLFLGFPLYLTIKADPVENGWFDD